MKKKAHPIDRCKLDDYSNTEPNRARKPLPVPYIVLKALGVTMGIIWLIYILFPNRARRLLPIADAMNSAIFCAGWIFYIAARLYKQFAETPSCHRCMQKLEAVSIDATIQNIPPEIKKQGSTIPGFDGRLFMIAQGPDDHYAKACVLKQHWWICHECKLKTKDAPIFLEALPGPGLPRERIERGIDMQKASKTIKRLANKRIIVQKDG